jgi:hypothetical protein
MRIAFIAIVCLFIAANNLHAFSIEPVGTDSGNTVRKFQLPFYERFAHAKMAGFLSDAFGNAVHERAIHMIYGCAESNPGDCTEPPADLAAPAAVLAGAQWNDNPPFRLSNTTLSSCPVEQTIKLPYWPVCWFRLFRDAEKRAEKGEFFDADSGAVLLYRSHFGDMQFLHSMASKDGMQASERGVELRKLPVAGMDQLFKNRGWSAQQLFTLGDPTFRGTKDFQDFVFGSLLHLVEDSFTKSHTLRDDPSGAYCSSMQNLLKPGEIISFNAYAMQDKDKHKKADSHDDLTVHLAEANPNVVDVGKIIKGFYDNRKPWIEVKPYFECLFTLQNLAALSSAGNAFVKD